MKGKRFVFSNVQNQFEAHLKSFKILLYATYNGILFIANLFQNIAKEDALIFADVLSNSQIL